MNSLDSASSLTAGDRAALAEYLEELARRIERGEKVTYEGEVAEHAEFAGPLGELWPALQLLVSLGKTSSTVSNELNPLADIGPSLGEFRILSELGRGGMGVVYEAEQGPLGRRVALKVLPFAAVLDQRQLARFQNEARAAASLHHTNIVPVFSVGCDRGRHYYAMQLIRGRSLEELLRERRERKSQSTPRGERLPQAPVETVNGLMDDTQRPQERFTHIARLGIQAAEALHCAHENGVVHRDVKPSNLLIDTSGKLWVADFGLARLGGDVGVTLTGDLLGTLRYMSPEQAAGMPAGVDHRTDIYSLGATLYELATDRPVVQGQDRTGMLREIAETDPAPPRKHAPAMPADLETILLKCLAKEPSARYDTAQALADDLRRFLEQKPIAARRPRLIDTLAKTARRHKSLVAAAALLFATLILGIICTTWQAIRATEAERVAELDREKAIEHARVAEEEAAVSQAIGEFLVNDLLIQAAPEFNPRHHKVTVEDLLDRAAKSIDERFADQPQVEATLRKTMGEAYARLGNYAAAQRQLEVAMALFRQEFGERNEETIDTMSNLADLFRLQGQPKQGERLAVQALKLSRDVYGNTHPDTMLSLNNLAAIYGSQAKYDLAEPLFEEAFETLRKELGPEDPGTLTAMNNVAMVYSWQAKYAQAEELLVDALDKVERVLGPEHPETLSSMNNLAACLKDQGKYDEAEPLFQRALDAAPRVLGPDSPGAIMALNNMASLRLDQRRYDEAEPLFLQTLDVTRRVQGPVHPHTLITTESLAELYIAQSKFDQAEQLLLSGLADVRQHAGDDAPIAAALHPTLGEVRLRQGRFAEAEALFRGALAAGDEHGVQDWPWWNIKSRYGETLLRQKKYAEAEPQLLAAFAGLESQRNKMPARAQALLSDAAKRLVELYTEMGKPDEANRWRAELEALRPGASGSIE